MFTEIKVPAGEEESGEPLYKLVKYAFNVWGGMGYSTEVDENGEIDCHFSNFPLTSIPRLVDWLKVRYPEFSVTIHKFDF